MIRKNNKLQRGYGGTEWIILGGVLAVTAYFFLFPSYTKEDPKRAKEQCYIDPKVSTQSVDFDGKTYVLLKQAAAIIRQQAGYHFVQIGEVTIKDKKYPISQVILDGDFNRPPLPTGFVIYTRPGRSEGGTYRPQSGSENLRFVDVSQNYPLVDKAYEVIDIYLLKDEPVPQFILDYCESEQPASPILLIQDTNGITLPNFSFEAGDGWGPRNVEYRMFAYDKRGSNSFNLSIGASGPPVTHRTYTFTSDGNTQTYDAYFLVNSSTETITLVNQDPSARDANIGYKYTPAEFAPQPPPPDLHKKSSTQTWSQQLEAFVPFGVPPWGWWTPECKPAVYLYPQKDTAVNVKVRISNGFLTYTDPLYPKDGWNVLAKPNGDLQYLSTNLANSKGIVNYPTGVFPYLYYEGKVQDKTVEKPTTGFIKKQSELTSFFDELLPKMGLNQKETKEFKFYWLAALPKASYYYIGIIPQEQLDKNEPLTITPKQDTMIRVRLLFQQLDKPEEIQEPIIQTPIRSGFTVVDWGAYVKQDKNHPFTCVQ